ncbi:hypothetical protein CGZ90_13755 [Fictibacillus aquaticus]|uniref:Transcriptional regulator n=1 Tax=Fictibacillus aquaticus TaxID=2021314 RepID=A0A235F9U4_9BACL|nr:hypothetical protein CGZ90_13755 [Fictibacillus aquaticus]
MIGKRLKKYRQARGLSISQLSAQSGVAKSYLSFIERENTCNPTVHILEVLASVLGIPVHWLLMDDSMGKLDSEWIALVNKAIDIGVTKEQFKEYLFLKNQFNEIH